MITTQQPITSCCYFHKHCAAEKEHRGNFQGHLLCICHPFGTKTSFQHCNLYLESSGCVSSLRCFLILQLTPALLSCQLLINAEKLHKPWDLFM